MKELKNLTVLDLSSNNLSDVSYLKELKNITSLHLSYNNVTDISFLKVFKFLTSLSLSNMKLKNYIFLKEFKNLTSLDLRYNNVTDISFLKELKDITSLDLSGTKLRDYSFLKELKNLTSLTLNVTKLKDYSFIKEMIALTSLYLGYNNLSDVSFIKELKNLTSLHLGYNNLNDVSFLKELKSLTSLYLSDNNLTDISFIKELKNLILLDLSGTKFKDYSFIKELKGLTLLYLSDNKINDGSFIKELKGLTSLYLSSNNLTDTSFLKELKSLTSLYLGSNNLTGVSFIKELKGLTSLYLSSNNLTDVSFIKELKGLTSLNLYFNNLTNVSFLKELKSLTSLDLSSNYLTDVLFLKNLRGLNSLYLNNNPIINPPKEIVDKGLDAIQKYFESLEQEGEEYAFEAKLILVGEPGAGKTSLARKILEPKYNLNPTEPMTKGIDIDAWYFPFNDEITFRANIWDFGGQDIMYATHRYFLTQRSLYIVLADNRKEDTDFYYWLRMAELLGGNSPVLIVLNEKYDFKKFIPQGLFESFDNIKDVFTINLATNKGLKDLTNAIQKYLIELPHVGKTPLPKSWVQIRKTLATLGKDHIDLKEYYEIYKKHNITDEKKSLFISEFLHDLGQVLHFQKDRLLCNRIILNPHWATEAVYLVLLDSVIIQNCGRFGNDDLKRIWYQEEYKYNHADLLRLMINFELCYEIGNTQVYIIPELLHEKPAKEGYPDAFKQGSSKAILHFEYRYTFIPKGIISRLIVRMNKYIYKNLQWKNGVVLNYHSYAEIIEYIHQRKLKIRLYGEDKNVCLGIMRKEIKDIHDSFEKLDYDEMIPCICDECRESKDPYFYKYKLLKRCKQKGKKTMPCEKSLDDVSVDQLLKGIEIKEKKRMDTRWDVFISYSSKDIDTIKQITADFKKNNITYWLDDEQIEPGDFIIDQLEKGFENSRFVLPCFSRNQLKSGWCRAEYQAFLYDVFSNQETRKKVVPLLIDDLDQKELPVFIRQIKQTIYADKMVYERLLEFFKGI